MAKSDHKLAACGVPDCLHRGAPRTIECYVDENREVYGVKTLLEPGTPVCTTCFARFRRAASAALPDQRAFDKKMARAHHKAKEAMLELGMSPIMADQWLTGMARDLPRFADYLGIEFGEDGTVKAKAGSRRLVANAADADKRNVSASAEEDEGDETPEEFREMEKAFQGCETANPQDFQRRCKGHTGVVAGDGIQCSCGDFIPRQEMPSWDGDALYRRTPQQVAENQETPLAPWPTPTATDANYNQSPETFLKRNAKHGKKSVTALASAAHLAVMPDGPPCVPADAGRKKNRNG